MSQWFLNLIGCLSFFLIWLPLFLSMFAVVAIFVIDAIRTDKLKEEFYNKLPYHYRSVIDAYKDNRYIFFRRKTKDCMIFKNSNEFKEYEENAKQYVDEEL